MAATWLSTLHSVLNISLTEVDPAGPLASSTGSESVEEFDTNLSSSTFYALHGHIYALAALVGVVSAS